MSGCIEWEGARTTAGYGEQRRDGKVGYVHRQTWEDAFGPIPDGLHVMHLCDNPPCYNLDHLALGTAQDNLRDMMTKGRGRGQFERRTHCKRGLHELTPENLYVHPKDGKRECNACRVERSRGGQ